MQLYFTIYLQIKVFLKMTFKWQYFISYVFYFRRHQSIDYKSQHIIIVFFSKFITVSTSVSRCGNKLDGISNFFIFASCELLSMW